MKPVANPKPISLRDLPRNAWQTQVPIRFGRCDAAGIVYTPQYFDLFIGVTEVWYQEELGIDYYGLHQRRRIGLGYAHASCDFFSPSSMGDVLSVYAVVGRVGRSSIAVTFHAMKDDRERARGRFVSVTTSLDDWSVLPTPNDVREAVLDYKTRCEAESSPTLKGLDH